MNNRSGKLSLFITALLLAHTGPVLAKNFGGPDAAENTIADDAKTKPAVLAQRLAQPWFDWKERIQQQHGFAIGFDYTPLYLASSATGISGNTDAGSGILRVFGAWELTGQDTQQSGALIWKLEHRHSYTDIAPQAFSFDQGYVGLIEPPFSDETGRWTNLYWRQRLNAGKTTIVTGLLDVTDFVDVYALASPWTGFMNFAFSTGSAAMFIPNDATFGVGVGTMLNKNMFLIASVTNAYTDPTRPFDTIDDFFKNNDYFSSIEFGITRSQERIYLDNTHITVWHVDNSAPAGTPGGWGMAFNYSRAIKDNTWMPFIRAGYADDGGTLLQKSLSIGLGYNAVAGRDQLGVAANWGQPNADSFGPGRKDQYALEMYYRYQLTEQLAITPDIQLLIDPAINPDKDSLWIFGLRLRLAL